MTRHRVHCLLFFFLTLALTHSAFGLTLKGRLVPPSGMAADTFRVVLISKGGSSLVADADSRGRFALRGSKTLLRSATLHLLDRTSGKYWGMVVYARKNKAYQKLVGTKTVDLGPIRMKNGFAEVLSKKAEASFSASKPVSFNPKTGPRAANKLGYVRAAKFGRASQGEGDGDAGDDPDGDGLQNQLDIDNDGDLKLDATDKDSENGNEEEEGSQAFLFTDYFLSISQTLNMNAMEVSKEQIDAFVRDRLQIVFGVSSAVGDVESVNLDCSSLAYCSASQGTATIVGPFSAPRGQLWRSYDTDGDGLPNLHKDDRGTEISIKPNVPPSSIKPGDTFIFRIKKGGRETLVTKLLAFYFVTSPALAAYDDGTGEKSITYPVASGGEGTHSNPIQLNSSSMKLKFWKPQRPNIPGAEPEGYKDMGGLKYGVYITSVNGNNNVMTCDAADYSNPSETLELLPSNDGGPESPQQYRDKATDTAPSTENLLGFTLDVGSCLQRKGISPAGASFTLDLVAVDNAHDNVIQRIAFRLR